MLQPKRLLSIDVLRAINMFFMIFVNDLSGVSHVPKWIDHVKGYEDGMHFADTIFPLFLFIAGLSIPLAIGRRIEKGNSFTSIAGYILLRSFALIVMGFFHVNMEEYSKQAFLPLPVNHKFLFNLVGLSRNACQNKTLCLNRYRYCNYCCAGIFIQRCCRRWWHTVA